MIGHSSHRAQLLRISISERAGRSEKSEDNSIAKVDVPTTSFVPNHVAFRKVEMRLTSWGQPKPELKLEGRGPGRHREFIDLVISISSTSSRHVSNAVLFLEYYSS